RTSSLPPGWRALGALELGTRSAQAAPTRTRAATAAIHTFMLVLLFVKRVPGRSRISLPRPQASVTHGNAHGRPRRAARGLWEAISLSPGGVEGPRPRRAAGPLGQSGTTSGGVDPDRTGPGGRRPDQRV